jgi:hypothetical protein
MAIVFLAGIIVLLIARAALTPDDFGTLGFYRAGAIDDARLRPIAYAGRAACEECHGGTYLSDADDAEAVAAADPKGDNGHALLNCEACHGPLYFHQVAKEKADRGEEESGPLKPVPMVTADTLCLSCHQEVAGRPAFQPQVVVGDHGAKDPCDSCHRPHRPRTDEDD